LVAHLIDKSSKEGRNVALPLPSKERMSTVMLSDSCNDTSDKPLPLLGWERFEVIDGDNRSPTEVEIFKRWWGSGYRYQHSILLWLQRAYVHEVDSDPEDVRSDDETPYDYDHICPTNHWSNWTGTRHAKGSRLIDFLSKENNDG